MTKVEDIKKTFKNPDLFELALTHRSRVNESRTQKGHNERLEFLGDAVLEYIVSSHLYKAFPDKEEGFLTALRANIVNTQNLSLLAKGLDLGSHIKLSKGESRAGGTKNPSLLADTVEALIGAIYLDLGLSKAKEFIEENLLSDLEKKLAEPLKDPKSRLQEIVQAKGLKTPLYQVASATGPDHAKNFIIKAIIDGKDLGSGTGKSKQEAEQAAAEQALEQLGEKR